MQTFIFLLTICFSFSYTCTSVFCCGCPLHMGLWRRQRPMDGKLAPLLTLTQPLTYGTLAPPTPNGREVGAAAGLAAAPYVWGFGAANAQWTGSGRCCWPRRCPLRMGLWRRQRPMNRKLAALLIASPLPLTNGTLLASSMPDGPGVVTAAGPNGQEHTCTLDLVISVCELEKGEVSEGEI